MTPLDIITVARDMLNDADSEGYRQSNEELLRYVNDALCECAMLAPQLFYSTGDLECVPNATEQAIDFADAQALADVLRVKGGRAILPCDRVSLSAFMPDWAHAEAAEAVHWMRDEGDPLRFFIYPPAPDAQILEITYVKVPQAVALMDEMTEIPATLKPALVNYVVAKAEMKDDEHVNAGRSVAAYQQFVALLRPA